MIHILVVDDDAALNKTVCTYLNDCGFETKGVLDAQSAFEEMYNSLYDLIVSDIMMPQMPSCTSTSRPSQKVFPKRRFCCIIIPVVSAIR